MKKETKKIRGIFEKIHGSNIWWICYHDGNGKKRREKVGRRGDAIKLYQKRKTEVLQGQKLPETFRKKPVLFSELAKDALEWSKGQKISYGDDVIRMNRLTEQFGTSTAESVTAQDVEKWFSEQNWRPATANRYKALLSLTYRIGIGAGKIQVNPAREIRRRTENNIRIRYLSKDEERKLRAVIANLSTERLFEFDVALHTGMRRSEQYGLTWDCVDLERRIITIPRSKHGSTRYVFLNDTALTALKTLRESSTGEGRVFVNGYKSNSTYGARQWFENCVEETKIPHFTWHCLRHTFASNLVMRGVDIRTVQELLGHRTIQMTLRYSHLAPQHQLAAVQRLCDTEVETSVARLDQQNASTDTKTDTSQFSAPVRNGPNAAQAA